jgi:hypothetical protein
MALAQRHGRPHRAAPTPARRHRSLAICAGFAAGWGPCRSNTRPLKWAANQTADADRRRRSVAISHWLGEQAGGCRGLPTRVHQGGRLLTKRHAPREHAVATATAQPNGRSPTIAVRIPLPLFAPSRLCVRSSLLLLPCPACASCLPDGRPSFISHPPTRAAGNPHYPDRIYYSVKGRCQKPSNRPLGGIKSRSGRIKKASKTDKKALAQLNIWSKNGPGASAKADSPPRGVSKVGNFTQSYTLK